MPRKPTYEELEQRIKELETEASERKLLENELILKSIVFDMSIAANSTADNEGMVNHVNSTFLKMWGYETKEEVMGNTIPHFFQNQDDAIPVLEALNKYGFWRGEFKAKRKDGSIFIYRGLSSAVRDEAGHQIGYYSVNIDVTEQKQAEDEIKELNASLEQRVVERTIKLEATNKQLNAEITERKQTEEALRKSEKKYRTLLETTSEGYWLLNSELKTIEVNAAFCKMLGYSQDEMLGKTPFDFVDDKNQKVFIEQTSKIADKKHRSYEIVLKKKNGQDLHTYLNGTTIIAESGEILGSFAFITDLSDRNKIIDERNLLFTAIEQSAESLSITDRNGKIQYVNPAFERLTGYGAEEVIGQNPRILKSGKQDDLFYKDMWEKLSRGQIFKGRMINKKKDGTFYTSEATISPVLDDSGKITNFVSIKRDVTKEMEMENHLAQAQKMESIGDLAGGIAHDFNNILTSVIGYTELSLYEVEKGTHIENNFQEIYTAGKRARDLVRQILAFARQSKDELKPIRVDTVATEALKFIRSSIPTTIEIRQNIESDSLIMGNATQVHQILMNLFTNAAYAMEDKGGILEFSFKDVVIDRGVIREKLDLKPGNYIEIKVSDTGAGIAPEIIGFIFDPYFTTKGPGEGTGMGLAMAHGIIESYGGKISVDSKPGQETVFTIYLPITGKRQEHRPYQSETLPAGTERILFVDDEAPIAKMEGQLLKSLGYTTSIRTSSIEALELFRTKPNDFDLVITDMTMPNMTGDDLAIELMKIRPDIPVIICTGYSKKISAETASDIGVKAVVYKPIVKADLAKEVRKILDEAKGGTHA